MVRIIMTAGTFDLFHVGHLELLRRASKLGRHLIVMVSTDEFNNVKGKKSIISYEDRKTMLEACIYVDKVVSENSWGDKERYIDKYDVNVFAIGTDWAGKFDDLPCEVIYLPRTEGVSTTMLKKQLK